MGFWKEKVLPTLVDKGMRNDVMAKQRHRAAPLARGRVLEIGMGSGLNIPLYNDNVDILFGLEPSAKLREIAAEPASEANFQVEMLATGAESIPLESNSVDSVVSSWTLCSLDDSEQSLQEIRRVLKPDGQLIFIEHGRAPDQKTAAWQRRLRPIGKALLGCDLDVPMEDLIHDAGFRFSNIEKAYLDGPPFLAYQYIGQATPV